MFAYRKQEKCKKCTSKYIFLFAVVHNILITSATRLDEEHFVYWKLKMCQCVSAVHVYVNRNSSDWVFFNEFSDAKRIKCVFWEGMSKSKKFSFCVFFAATDGCNSTCILESLHCKTNKSKFLVRILSEHCFFFGGFSKEKLILSLEDIGKRTE